MVDVVHEPIDDEQTEMHIWPPADFCNFSLEHAVPNFWTLLTECKYRMMVELSQFITFASSRIHWRGSLWINVFKRYSSNPEGLSEREVSLMSSYLAQQPRSDHGLPQALPPGFSISGGHPPIGDFQSLYILYDSIHPSEFGSSNSPSPIWFIFWYSFDHFTIIHSLDMSCPF